MYKRQEYNQEAQRATHFIVDETQVVSRKGTSAEQLNTAVATFRKYGGICTMAMQNITAALENKMLKELFSNCNYKCCLLYTSAIWLALYTGRDRLQLFDVMDSI